MLDQASPASEKKIARVKTDHQTVVAGRVYSFTLLQEPPLGFEAQAPYYLALVAMDSGGLVTAQLTDIDDTPRIGDRVEMVTRKLTTDGSQGMIVYGYKFRPVLKPIQPSET